MIKALKYNLALAVMMAASFFAGVAHAQVEFVNGVDIDAVTKQISGTITNTQSGDITVWFENETGTSGIEILSVPWDAGLFFTNLNDWDIQSNTVSGSAGTFTHLHVGSSQQGTEFKVPLSTVISGAAPSVTVDFPGWEEVIFNQIPNSGGKYYPIIKSKQSAGQLITRNPADAKIDLVIQDQSVGTYAVLQTIPGGAANFNVTFQPDCPTQGSCTLPTAARLDPGTTYAIFLSDDFGNVPNFGTAVNYNGESTLEYIDTPGGAVAGSITVNSATITNDQTSLQINATAQSGFQGVVEFKIIGTDTNNPNDIIELSLGTVTNPSGSFTFPQSPQTYALGGFSTYTVQAVVNDTVLSEYTIGSGSNNNGNGNSNGNNNNNNGNNNGSSNGIENIYSATQTAILNTGIVPNCGYNLTEGGRMCSFTDLITLVQNVIEYIFILTVPIVAIVFAYAGYLYLTSGGNSGKREQAKNAMINVVIGIVVVMSAWLLVTLVVRTLGASPETTQFLDI